MRTVPITKIWGSGGTARSNESATQLGVTLRG
jgi:hypothetical protein